MKRALRFPSRWAGRLHTLGITAVLTIALGACSNLYGAREGTIEYPGSGATPNSAASYVVKNKDTVDGIARRYGVSPQTIIERNKLKPPYMLRAGQTIEIPGARVVEPSSSTETAAASPNPPAAVKREALAPPPGQSESSRSEAPKSAAPAPEPGQPTPLSPPVKEKPTHAPRFEWPVRGKVVVPYGNHDGQKSDGIDIQAEKDAPVHAADSGTVVYAGNEVRGMGNLLLVSHPGGYITAYGYNDSLLVKKGEAVKKGQTIAKVGTSGSAPDPRLHFEVRRGNKTIDPMTVLPAQ
ncbi:MAG: M23 family metallopeptidase [Proteobacteria bacterium]|nr:M23 family metallopeptidase [Pseudomonadota bacterium]